jgi:uncharacterized membrane protein YfcA
VTLESAALLSALGLLAAFLSGLLGIGGGLIIVPLVLYVPRSLGLDPSSVGMADFDVKAAAAIAVAQVAVASGSGTLANLRRRLVHRQLALVIVGAMVIGAFASGWGSQFAPSGALLLLFAILATLGALAMLLPPARHELGPSHPRFSRLLAGLCGLGVGSVIGLVGSGAFLLIPLQVYVLRIPTRTAMATGLAAGFPTAASALIGKALGGQVPLLPAAAVCLLAIPGAQLGTLVSARLSARMLRRAYALVVLTVAAGLWFDVLHAR